MFSDDKNVYIIRDYRSKNSLEKLNFLKFVIYIVYFKNRIENFYIMIF